MTNQTHKTRSRFASSNSFFGFRSYFGEAFDSEKYDRIIVLKGGPGTGKNTLMRKCAKLSEQLGFDTEKIYCSSDPKSLDGVIINNEKKRVAVLDGTAPHERDAVIPGAVDIIINLGEAFNKEGLALARNRIIELNKSKSESYYNAYTELKLSSIYWTKIKAELTESLDLKKLRLLVNDIQSKDYASQRKPCRRLVSSFSKFGYKSLSLTDDTPIDITLNGDPVLSALLCTNVGIHLFGKESVLLSPLDPDVYEGLRYGSTMVSIQSGGKASVCADEFFSIEPDAEHLCDLKENMIAHMTLAAEHLEAASVSHFSLEDIYSPMMDFDKIYRITSGVLDEIKNILLT